ncbi:MAG: site-2 protease family protein [Phycisphaeraceae bacterium]|nr:site-2 protease family protein [Phycisphaeraceae bacterium]
MLPEAKGSLRIFTLFRIPVYVHWTWLILVYFVYQTSHLRYESPIWGLAELVGVFAIVTLHEFGHALACRSVGGEARQIVLWPLGGVAFVRPPRRPGATLWSIAAGPLVNLMLVPATIVMLMVAVPDLTGNEDSIGQTISGLSDLEFFLVSLAAINLIMLIFNLLPAFPLDGGQILQSLLWYFIGYARALWVSALIGLLLGLAIGVLGFVLLGSFWLPLIAAFIAFNSWQAFKAAGYMISEERQRMGPWNVP